MVNEFACFLFFSLSSFSSSSYLRNLSYMLTLWWVASWLKTKQSVMLLRSPVNLATLIWDFFIRKKAGLIKLWLDFFHTFFPLLHFWIIYVFPEAKTMALVMIIVDGAGGKENKKKYLIDWVIQILRFFSMKVGRVESWRQGQTCWLLWLHSSRGRKNGYKKFSGVKTPVLKKLCTHDRA